MTIEQANEWARRNRLDGKFVDAENFDHPSNPATVPSGRQPCRECQDCPDLPCVHCENASLRSQLQEAVGLLEYDHWMCPEDVKCAWCSKKRAFLARIRARSGKENRITSES